MRESEVEKQFVAAVKAAGGQALKFTSQTVDALLCWTPGEPIPQGIGAKIPEMPEVNLPEKGGGV